MLNISPEITLIRKLGDNKKSKRELLFLNFSVTSLVLEGNIHNIDGAKLGSALTWLRLS